MDGNEAEAEIVRRVAFDEVGRQAWQALTDEDRNRLVVYVTKGLFERSDRARLEEVVEALKLGSDSVRAFLDYPYSNPGGFSTSNTLWPMQGPH